jgi:hypothetical protein
VTHSHWLQNYIRSSLFAKSIDFTEISLANLNVIIMKSKQFVRHLTILILSLIYLTNCSASGNQVARESIPTASPMPSTSVIPEKKSLPVNQLPQASKQSAQPLSQPQSVDQNSNSAKEGISIKGVEARCGRVGSPESNSEICESSVILNVKNLTSKPQKYLVVKIDLFDDLGNKLNDACLSGVDMVDFGSSLPPQGEKTEKVVSRKYFKYDSAKLVSSQWYGFKKPNMLEINPEVNHQCP